MKRFEANNNPMGEFNYSYIATTLLKDNFIKNEHLKCDDWLVEYINLSKYFLNLSKGQKYKLVEKQDNKEDDCVADDYKMDFKRLVSNTYMYAKSNTSNIITKCDNGMYVESSPKSTSEYKAYLLEKVCRFTELSEYENPDTIDDEDRKNDIETALKIIKTKKHLLCLFPMQVFPVINSDINSFEKSLLYVNLCYRDLFLYREMINPRFDSYICYFYNDRFILTKFNNNEFVVIDEIKKNLSETFKKGSRANGYSFIYNLLENRDDS